MIETPERAVYNAPLEGPLRRFRIITLDVGGTLIFPHPSVGEVYSEVLARHEVVAPADEIEKRFGEIFAGLRTDPRPHVDDAEEKRFWRELVGQVLDGLCDARVFPAVFDELYGAFAVPERWRLADDALETIRKLGARGYQLAILSNADTRIRRVLKGLGILAEIPDAFISAEIGFEKPDPRIFRHVERTLGAKPEDFLHVGDSDFHDGGGARAAGWEVLILDGRLDLAAGKIACLTDLLGLGEPAVS
ncbi:MAG TPA: HAD family hydrolase [Chloroflexi bacterium]|nr:HAD family hydrolase [Chloroflexota bacterium]